MVGNDTPVFFMRDPMKFQDFIRSQKRRADNDMRDNDMQWDFWTLSPETAHQVTWLLGDRGIPRTWRHMDGFSSHTFMWVNADGEQFWVRYHFKTDQGIEFFTQDEADRMAGSDGDYHRRDLWEAIERGEYPSWSLKMQIMPFEEAKTYRFNPFDLTKVISQKDYPLIPVGTMTLDRNPTNYHTEIELAAFEVSNLVPGIGPSPDKMLLGRMFSYADAHRARIGANYNELPVNRPHAGAAAQLREGRAHAAPQPRRPGLCAQLEGRSRRGHRALRRARRLACRRRPGARRVHPPRRGRRLGPARHPGSRRDGRRGSRLGWSATSSAHLCNGVSEPVLQRAFDYWKHVDEDIGDRIEAGVRVKQGGRDGDGAGRPKRAAPPPRRGPDCGRRARLSGGGGSGIRNRRLVAPQWFSRPPRSAAPAPPRGSPAPAVADR